MQCLPSLARLQRNDIWAVIGMNYIGLHISFLENYVQTLYRGTHSQSFLGLLDVPWRWHLENGKEIPHWSWCFPRKEPGSIRNYHRFSIRCWWQVGLDLDEYIDNIVVGTSGPMRLRFVSKYIFMSTVSRTPSSHFVNGCVVLNYHIYTKCSRFCAPGLCIRIVAVFSKHA